MFGILVCGIIIGIIGLALWAWAHEEVDEEDDRRRAKAIRKLEDEVDRLTKE